MPLVLLALIGIIAGPSTWRLVCKRLTAGGYPVWGFVFGAGALTGLYLLANLPFVIEFRRDFTHYGPCSLCYEWSGMPFLFLMIGWGLGGVLYLLLSVITLARVVRAGKSRLFKTPPWMWKGLWAAAGMLVLLGAGVLVARQVQVTALLKALQGRKPASKAVLLGSLPMSPAFRPTLMPSYIERDGLSFSPDGRWLALKFTDRLELWDMQDLSRRTVFNQGSKTGWQGTAAFNPDSSLLAYAVNQGIQVLSLESSQLSWQYQAQEPVHALTFDRTGEYLLALQPNALLRLRAVDGALQLVTALERPLGYSDFRLDRYGELAASTRQGEFLVVETFSAKELSRYVLPGSQEQGSYAYGLTGFLPDGRLFFWGNLSSQGGASFVLEPDSGAVQTIELSLQPGGENATLGFDPLGRLGVLASGGSILLFDLASWHTLEQLPDNGAVTAAAFSPDGELLLVSCADGRLYFYSLRPE